MSNRIVSALVVVLLGFAGARAKGEALDATPVSLNNAQNWCVARIGPLPSWDTPAHPECKMIWRVLAERDDRILYSARYAWPSPQRSGEPLLVRTEVLFEGVRGSRVVRPLFAAQEDEAHVRLEPLRVLTIGASWIVASRVCMSGKGECGRELAVWTDGRVAMIKDHTVAEIRSQLPKGYDLKLNPEIDLASKSGSGKVWATGDAECCPSATIEFTLRLDDREIHIDEMKFQRRPG